MTRKNLFGRSTSQGMIGRARSSDIKTMTKTTTFDLRNRKIMKTRKIDPNMSDKVGQKILVYSSTKPKKQGTFNLIGRYSEE